MRIDWHTISRNWEYVPKFRRPFSSSDLLDLAIAVLALLKSGAVSVALDPDFPGDRLAFMLEDTSTRLIVTQSKFLDRLPPHEARTLCLDEEMATLACRREDNPSSGVVADNLCAYFYTSGSSGIPKAVMMTHRVGCRVQWTQLNAVKLDEHDRALVTTSVGYGFFLGEIAPVLIRGGTAVLVRGGGYQDVDYLIDIVARRQVTVVYFVPSVLKHFVTRLEERGYRGCAQLKHIVSQGESLPVELQERLSTNLATELHNFYGLTEAPTASYRNCRQSDVEGRTTIGRPTDMEFYLLDADMNHVPVGETGEIYLSGPGMVRGYFNRPDLTAERFLPNPFSSQPGARLPDRRPRPLAPRGRDRVPRPERSTGQDSWRPGRTRRGRDQARPTSFGARGRSRRR